jgi:hypothetical protein
LSNHDYAFSLSQLSFNTFPEKSLGLCLFEITIYHPQSVKNNDLSDFKQRLPKTVLKKNQVRLMANAPCEGYPLLLVEGQINFIDKRLITI